MAKYHTVNSVWPDTVPPITDQEALSAARRLWRFAMKSKLPYKLRIGKLRGRSMDIDSGGMVIDHRRHGWHGLVHSMSHRCHWRLYRHTKDFDSHDHRHAFLEREMIRHVVQSGWLTGTLRRPEKPKPQIDQRQQRHARVLAGIARWQAKQRRAEKALAKLARQRRHYERQQIAV